MIALVITGKILELLLLWLFGTVIIFRGKVLIIITVYSIENTVLFFWNSLSTIIIVIVRHAGHSAVNHEPWTRVSHYH